MPEIIIDGIKTNYLFAGDHNKQLPTVVFIHGACQSLWNWKYQIQYFKSYRRLNFVAIDLPGHGSSEGTGFKAIKDYADFTCRFTEELNLEEIILIGHSMGGRISQVIMIEHPDKVIGSVLCGTGAKLRVTRATFQAIEKGFGYFADIASRNSFSKNAPGELKEEFKKNLLSSNYKVCYNDMVACNEFDVKDDISQAELPTFIVGASDDVLAPPEYSRDLNKRIKGSTLKILAGSGHFMMLEKPAEFNGLIKTFLDII